MFLTCRLVDALGLQEIQGPLDIQPACSIEQDAPDEGRGFRGVCIMKYARSVAHRDVDLVVASVLNTQLVVGMTLSEFVY